MPVIRSAVVIGIVFAISACSSAGGSGGGHNGASTKDTRPAAEPVPKSAPAATTPTTAAGLPFVFTAVPVDAASRARIVGSSWHEGCPVPLEDLRYVRVSYWDFDGAFHVGELVVHADVTTALEAALHSLFDQKYPVRSMRLVDDFGGDDFASIEVDNSSAFNCRQRTDTAGEWSQHSYGRAIDLNPIENPYVSTAGSTAHPASRPYLDRANVRPGMVTAGDLVVQAFAAVGWEWGGAWSGPIDYQHFSRDNR